MQSLDFLVIGAQKAGTTSFYHYIRSHPSVFVPSRKEIPFFCADERYQKGWVVVNRLSIRLGCTLG
jgi:hypothetical protein